MKQFSDYACMFIEILCNKCYIKRTQLPVSNIN